MLFVFFLLIKLVTMEIMTSVILTKLNGLEATYGVKGFILPERGSTPDKSSSLRSEAFELLL